MNNLNRILKLKSKFHIVPSSMHFSTSNVLKIRGVSRRNPFEESFPEIFEKLQPDELKRHIDFESDINLEQLQNRSAEEIMDYDASQRRQKFKSIEKKYFLKKGPKEPNLLTWDMKEQLRNLHFSSPDMWNPETLSIAFPISPEGVKRLLRSTNKPSTDEALKQHDLMVLQRWKELTNGEMGSFALLKKTILKRFTEITKTTLPSISVGTSEQEFSFLQGLKFTPEDDLFASKEEDRQMHLKKLLKKIRMKQSFKSIIKDYENQVNNINNPTGESDGKENVPNTYLQCQNLKEVLPVNEYDSESFVKVNSFVNDASRPSNSSGYNSHKKPTKGKHPLRLSLNRKPLTYDEYKLLKTKIEQ